MNKKKWSLLLALFFLVQSIIISPIFSFESSSLNPPTLDSNCAQGRLKQLLVNAVSLGVFIYKLDALEGLTKQEISTRYPSLFFNRGVFFDVNDIDTVKHEGALIRYYPFSIEGKNFIMRIFLPYDGIHPPDAPVLYEVRLHNPEVVFQVLPSLNEILADCKIKPRQIYSSSEVNRSS